MGCLRLRGQARAIDVGKRLARTEGLRLRFIESLVFGRVLRGFCLVLFEPCPGNLAQNSASLCFFSQSRLGTFLGTFGMAQISQKKSKKRKRIPQSTKGPQKQQDGSNTPKMVPETPKCFQHGFQNHKIRRKKTKQNGSN